MRVLRLEARQEGIRVAFLLEIRQYPEHIDGLAVAEQALVHLLRRQAPDLQVRGIGHEEGGKEQLRNCGTFRIILLDRVAHLHQRVDGIVTGVQAVIRGIGEALEEGRHAPGANPIDGALVTDVVLDKSGADALQRQRQPLRILQNGGDHIGDVFRILHLGGSLGMAGQRQNHPEHNCHQECRHRPHVAFSRSDSAITIAACTAACPHTFNNRYSRSHELMTRL